MKQLLVAVILVFLAGCDTSNSVSTPPVPEVGAVRGQLVYEDTGEGVATTVKLFPVDIGDDGSSFIFSSEMVEHIRSLRTTAGGFLFDDVRFLLITKW
jgi:hypothetical protein